MFHEQIIAIGQWSSCSLNMTVWFVFLRKLVEAHTVRVFKYTYLLHGAEQYLKIWLLNMLFQKLHSIN